MTHQGPVIDLVVGVSHPRKLVMQKNGIPIPNPIAIRGLIDTGASSTCLDPSVIAELQLVQTGAAPMLTPSTGAAPVTMPTYDVEVSIPATGIGLTNVNGACIPIMAATLKSQGIEALIGRDLLKDATLYYNGPVGAFTLSF